MCFYRHLGNMVGVLSWFEALFHFTGVRFDNKLDWDKNTTALYRSAVVNE